MANFLSKIWNDKRGNALVIAGAALPLLVGSAGMATDTIQWTLWKRQLQRAADSAAIAGVYQRVQGGAQTEVEDAVDRDLALNQQTGITLLNDPAVLLIADAGTMRQQVDVTLALRKPLAFSSMFMSQAPTINAHARAASVPGTDEYCVVSLETDAGKSGITVGGNAKIEMDCGFISNSPAFNSALSNGNSSSVKASVIAAVGGVQASNNWDVGKYDPYVSPIIDPYANVNIDRSQMNCFSHANKLPLLGTATSNNFNGANATVTLDDARAYTGQESANCFRGLSVPSGESMTLDPGVYYIGEGGINIQGTLSAPVGVTLVLTNIDTTKPIGTIDVNAGAHVTLVAPATGNYAGIAIYQDRNATDSNGTNNKINGNATNAITGAVYFPRQEIIYNGSGTSAWMCTRLVGRRVVFSGNAGISNKFEKSEDCPGSGLDPIEGGPPGQAGGVMRAFLDKLRREKRGTATIELAIAAPMLATFVIGIVDISNAYSRKLVLEQAAQRSIEKIMQTTADTTVDETIVNEAASAADIDVADVTLDYWLECDGDRQDDYDADVCDATEVEARYITLTLEDAYAPLFPVRFSGIEPDGTYHLSATTGIRIK